MLNQYESYTKSISNFVRWAHDRIEKEIESNEKCERKFGDAEVFKDYIRLPSNLPDKDKYKYIKEVEQTYASNPKIGRKEACAINGIHFTTFYKWRSQLREKGIIN